jgi:hypothetical protein
MSSESADQGVIAVLMKRFEERRLPRALDIRQRVEKGERLSEADIVFLNKVLADSHEITRLAEQYPEYQKLYSQRAALYGEITQKALENEKKSS